MVAPYKKSFAFLWWHISFKSFLTCHLTHQPLHKLHEKPEYDYGYSDLQLEVLNRQLDKDALFHLFED